MRLTKFSTGLGLLVAVLALMGGTALAQEEQPAVVTVFHAVPAADGFPADVYLNGDLIIDGFVFETSSESFEVSPGSATLEIYSEGSNPDSDSPTVSTPVTLEASKNYSIVAQLADGSPVISLFENDTSGVGPGEARVTFRQTSSLPELNVSLDGQETFSAIVSTNEATIDRDAGLAQLEIDDGSATLFERAVDIEDGELTVLYAVGDSATDSFDVLVQEVALAQDSPTGIPTGNGGQRAPSNLAWIVASFSAMAISGLAWGIRHRRA